MKEQHTYDSEFQDRLDNYMPMPPNDLGWDQMSEELLEKLEVEKKRRKKDNRRLWFLLFLLFISSSIVISLVKLGKPWIEGGKNKNATANTIVKNTPRDSFKDTLKNIIPKHAGSSQVKSNKNSLEIQRADNYSRGNFVFVSKIDTIKTRDVEHNSTNRLKNHPQSISKININSPLLSTNIKLLDSISPILISTSQQQNKDRTEKWAVILHGGANQWKSHYRNDQTPDLTPEIYETNLIGWHVGVHLKREFRNHLFVESGIEVERLRYRFDIDTLENKLLYRPNTIDSIFISIFTGDSSIVYADSVPGNQRTLIRNYNSHYLFSIPLFIGYKIPFQRFSISPFVGINMNLYSQHDGLTSEKFPDIIRIEDEKLYRKGVLFDGVGGLRAQYRITDYLALNLGGTLRLSLNDWVKSQNYSFSKRPISYRGQIGLTYYFQ